MRNAKEMAGGRNKGWALMFMVLKLKGYLNKYSGMLYAYVFKLTQKTADV
jgi:hypothetical protein